jgi:hypothetical protein
VSLFPSWPFGKTVAVPHRENAPREQCIPCAGGGEINGVPCYDCDGRGWFDQHNPKPGG